MSHYKGYWVRIIRFGIDYIDIIYVLSTLQLISLVLDWRSRNKLDEFGWIVNLTKLDKTFFCDFKTL
jgi:hypothetical protein